MNILINATNQTGLGGVQVTDSFCRNLFKYQNHKFVVVLTSHFTNTKKAIRSYKNVELYEYQITNSISTLLLGRDKFLDNLVERYKVDVVLTMFAPSRWNPRCPHLAGFALSQLVIPESPFYRILSFKELVLQKIRNTIWRYYFHTGTHFLYTENSFITERLKRMWPNFEAITITNYYNQIFDNPERWEADPLPSFEGTTILTLSRNDKHKYLPIIPLICKVLAKKYPEYKFRFVLPEIESNFVVSEEVKNHICFIGKVPIEKLPCLYEQCDFSFQPTLLECFTATFPEAMRMKKPIVACNLEFAKGLCGDAALYFDWDNPEQAADLIYQLSKDQNLYNDMVTKGEEQLKTFDNYDQRADQLILAIENLVNIGSLLNRKCV